MRAHQPGSTPIDIPETVPNPAHTPAPAPAPERAPTKAPDKVPEKVIAPASFDAFSRIRPATWPQTDQQFPSVSSSASRCRQGCSPSPTRRGRCVADRINALLSPDAKETGPFWCASEGAACQYISQKRPPEPFQTAQGYVVRRLRLTDKRARSGSPFRLFGTASVGSQSLTGIARLHRLRNDPKFAAVSEVWPFETGWATKANWLPKHILVLHAEIYPSVRDPLPDEIKDRGQVRAMWQWARDLDCDNLLWREFCRPIEVETGSKEDLAIQLTEGWILGCSPTVTNQ
jgi:hypothetical protein